MKNCIVTSIKQRTLCLCLKNKTDKLAISLSFCCIAHCIILPLLILLFPSISSLWINNGQFHLYIVILAIPFSFFAMFKNLKKHNNLKCIIMAGIGFSLLFLAVKMHDIGLVYETTFTIIGAIILITSHLINIRYLKN